VTLSTISRITKNVLPSNIEYEVTKYTTSGKKGKKYKYNSLCLYLYMTNI